MKCFGIYSNLINDFHMCIVLLSNKNYLNTLALFFVKIKMTVHLVTNVLLLYFFYCKIKHYFIEMEDLVNFYFQ